jgi:6,7-dimethyl-8-ribityllumazine synthase
LATHLKNLNQFEGALPDGSAYYVAIVVSSWNTEVTNKLLDGALEALQAASVHADNIRVAQVPGTYELALGAQFFADLHYDAVICLGCVIQGETRHFDFICHAAAQGIMNIGLTHDKPVIFGVLTTDNQEQALDRAGGKHGNKGYEAGVTALQMIALKKSV